MRHDLYPLDLVENYLRRFVSYPSEHALVAHVLWIAHCHMFDRFDTTPRLAFMSAEKESGKSRALEVTSLFVPDDIREGVDARLEELEAARKPAAPALPPARPRKTAPTYVTRKQLDLRLRVSAWPCASFLLPSLHVSNCWERNLACNTEEFGAQTPSTSKAMLSATAEAVGYRRA